MREQDDNNSTASVLVQVSQGRRSAGSVQRVTRPWLNTQDQVWVNSGTSGGAAAHLTEVDGAVFPADVLLALVVGRLGLRRDRLACEAERESRRHISVR